MAKRSSSDERLIGDGRLHASGQLPHYDERFFALLLA